MAPIIPYYPTAKRASLRPSCGQWWVWLERPGEPAEACVFTREDVADAIGGSQLSNQEAVIAWIGRCLKSADYLTTSVDPPLGTGGFIASWALAPAK
jgi:hypothetical protein